MAKPLSLDFSIGESIVKGINSTAEVEKGSVNINSTDVSLVEITRSIMSDSNSALDLVTNNIESGKNNYESALNSFKALQDSTPNICLGVGAKTK